MTEKIQQLLSEFGSELLDGSRLRFEVVDKLLSLFLRKILRRLPLEDDVAGNAPYSIDGESEFPAERFEDLELPISRHLTHIGFWLGI